MEKKDITYTEIELALANYYGTRQNIIVPNCFINWGTVADHECDLIVIRPSRYAEEVEIKRSLSDFKADFKKKHGHIDPRLKHLYYAMPDDVYAQCKDMIPDYAGVYVITLKYGRPVVQCVKVAPKKECRKLTAEEVLKIARLGAMRIWKLKEINLKLRNG